MKPKISIITITYNSEKTLEQTILSVVGQDYNNLEYLIIDGGSTDKTLDIVERYRDKISFVISEPDKGISDAFNKGIFYATGEIIGIINSDDLLLPNALQTIADNYEKDIDVYRGNTVIWNPDTDHKLSTKPTMRFPIARRIKSVCHQSTFITKNAYEKYGKYDETFRYMMDADVLHRFYINGATFKYINYDLALFRQGGVTSDKWTKKLREYKLLVTNNGGSVFLAYYRIMQFSLYNIIKNVLFHICDEDKLRKLKYKQ